MAYNIENNSTYGVIAIEETNNGEIFWENEGATFYDAGVKLARALNLPVSKATFGESPDAFALPVAAAVALSTIFESCRGWLCDQLSTYPVFFSELTGAELGERFNLDEPSGDAEPQTDAEPSEEQEPDDDYRRTFDKVFGALVFDYCVENYEHTDEQENAIEAYTLDAQRLESYAARKSVVYQIEADNSYAPEDYLENAERVDALDDESQEFYVDALDNYGLDPFGAIDAAEDFERLDSSEQTLCRTLIEDEHESADLAVERAKKDFWYLCNVRRGHMSADYIIGAAYIDNLGGLDTLDAKTIEQFFDFEAYGADLRKYDNIVETPDGDVWIEH